MRWLLAAGHKHLRISCYVAFLDYIHGPLFSGPCMSDQAAQQSMSFIPLYTCAQAQGGGQPGLVPCLGCGHIHVVGLTIIGTQVVEELTSKFGVESLALKRVQTPSFISIRTTAI